MILHIDYDQVFDNAIISAEEIDEWHWNTIVSNINNSIPSVRQFNDSLYIPIDMFISIMGSIANYARNHRILIHVCDSIRPILSQANRKSYSAALEAKKLSDQEISEGLTTVGFKRVLTDNQQNNISIIGRMPSAATFSVPGAGKTTEALAFFFLNAQPTDKLLVVAPKNAFGAWDEQLADCMDDKRLSFVRLRGGEENIKRLLKDAPRFAIITYQQYPRVIAVH